MSKGARQVQETMNESNENVAKTGKNKLYSGVIFEPVDDEKNPMPRYLVRNQKSTGDYIRCPSKNYSATVPSQNKVLKATVEPTHTSSLSTAIDYIISPVKYLASAFSHSSPEPDKVLQRSRSKLSMKTKTDTVPKMNMTQLKAIDLVTKITDPSINNIVPPVSREIILFQTHPRVASKSNIASFPTQTKDKHSLQKKRVSNKKTIDPKKSQSQQMKGSPKTYTSLSPQKYPGNIGRHSPSPSRTTRNMTITQSNQMSYRVTSGQEYTCVSEKDILQLWNYENIPTMSWGSNISRKHQVSPKLLTHSDETSFPLFTSRRFATHSIRKCSNSMSDNWNMADAYTNKSSFQPDLSQFNPNDESPTALRSPKRNSAHGNEVTFSQLQPLLTSPADMKSHRSSSLSRSSALHDSLEEHDSPARDEHVSPPKKKSPQRVVIKTTSPKSVLAASSKDTIIFLRAASPGALEKSTTKSPKSSPSPKANNRATQRAASPTTATQKKTTGAKVPSPNLSKKKLIKASPVNSYTRQSAQGKNKVTLQKQEVEAYRKVSKQKTGGGQLIIPPTILTESTKRIPSATSIASTPTTPTISNESTKSIPAGAHSYIQAATGAAASVVRESSPTEIKVQPADGVGDVTVKPSVARASEIDSYAEDYNNWFTKTLRSMSPKRNENDTRKDSSEVQQPPTQNTTTGNSASPPLIPVIVSPPFLPAVASPPSIPVAANAPSLPVIANSRTVPQVVNPHSKTAATRVPSEPVHVNPHSKTAATRVPSESVQANPHSKTSATRVPSDPVHISPHSKAEITKVVPSEPVQASPPSKPAPKVAIPSRSASVINEAVAIAAAAEAINKSKENETDSNLNVDPDNNDEYPTYLSPSAALFDVLIDAANIHFTYMTNYCSTFLRVEHSLLLNLTPTENLPSDRNMDFLQCDLDLLAPEGKKLFVHFLQMEISPISNHYDRLHLYDLGTNKTRLTPIKGLYGRLDIEQSIYDASGIKITDYRTTSSKLKVEYLGKPTKRFQGFGLLITIFQDPSTRGECPSRHYLCSRAAMCIQDLLVCDGNPNCGQDDDGDESVCDRYDTVTNLLTEYSLTRDIIVVILLPLIIFIAVVLLILLVTRRYISIKLKNRETSCVQYTSQIGGQVRIDKENEIYDLPTYEDATDSQKGYEQPPSYVRLSGSRKKCDDMTYLKSEDTARVFSICEATILGHKPMIQQECLATVRQQYLDISL